MTSRSTLAKIATGVAATALAVGALAPVAASAQPPSYDQRTYDAQGGYYYNGCERAQNGRAIAGGLAGAAAGAVIGGNVASRHVRDEGGLLGGFLGAVIGSAGGALLDRVELFDLYRGKGVPEGKRSLAYRLRFQSAERTLTDAEVDRAVAQVIARLQGDLDVQVRG